jgi:adenosylhomocysteine nucleosidase
MQLSLRTPFALLFVTVLTATLAAEYGPRDFDETEQMTAIVAAYGPEIKAIDAALEAHPDAEVTESIFFSRRRISTRSFQG